MLDEFRSRIDDYLKQQADKKQQGITAESINELIDSLNENVAFVKNIDSNNITNTMSLHTISSIVNPVNALVSIQRNVVKFLSDITKEIVTNTKQTKSGLSKGELKDMNKSLKIMAKPVKGKVGGLHASTVDPTKIIKSSAKNDKANAKIGTPKLDNKLIAKSMSDSIGKAFNAMTMVGAFIKKMLPLVIVFGLLLYGFITGYLDGTVSDFIAALVGIIVTAVIAYISYLIIKENVIFALKVTCEWIKVAIEAAADWATFPIIVGIVLLIGAAFLLAAGLIVLIIGGAALIMLAGMFIIVKAMQVMVNSMISNITSMFDEEIDEIGTMITNIIETSKSLVTTLSETMSNILTTLNGSIKESMSELSSTFGMMYDVMNNLAKSINDTFNGLAAAILASTLGQMFARKKEEETRTTQLQQQTTFVGLGGGDAFSKLIEPLVANTTQIVALLTKLVENASMKSNGYAYSAGYNTFNSQNANMTTNYVMPNDSYRNEGETTYVQGSGVDDSMTASVFINTMKEVKELLEGIKKASSMSESAKSSFMPWG